jgi:hypothetical protein
MDEACEAKGGSARCLVLCWAVIFKPGRKFNALAAERFNKIDEPTQMRILRIVANQEIAQRASPPLRKMQPDYGATAASYAPLETPGKEASPP